MGLIGKAISTGIGLGTEFYAARKARSQYQEPPQSSSSSTRNISEQRNSPPAYNSASSSSSNARRSQEGEDDEEDWDLDEAQAEVSSSRPQQDAIRTGEDSETAITRIIDNFVYSHPEASRTTSGRLAHPVILPQRRPENRERGFIRAYAPELDECGIDQQTFLDFIEAFNKASEASPVFSVIQVGAGIAGFTPSLIAQLVSLGVQVGTSVAQTYSVKRQTNGFLEEMNEKLFKPHNLFCLIMTFKPDSRTQSTPMDISSTILKAATKTVGRLGNFHSSSGKTRGEMELPETAPLVFPALDQAAIYGMGGYTGFKNTVADYFDRRSQAKFIQSNPNSALSGQTPQFASRFADPTHPGNSGGLRGLVLGASGLDSVRSGRRGRRGRRGERYRSRSRSRSMERPPAPRQRGVKRFMKKDIIYLMIVNMPTEAELAAYKNGIHPTSPESSSSASNPPSPQYNHPPQYQSSQYPASYSTSEQEYYSHHSHYPPQTQIRYELEVPTRYANANGYQESGYIVNSGPSQLRYEYEERRRISYQQPESRYAAELESGRRY